MRYDNEGSRWWVWWRCKRWRCWSYEIKMIIMRRRWGLELLHIVFDGCFDIFPTVFPCFSNRFHMHWHCLSHVFHMALNSVLKLVLVWFVHCFKCFSTLHSRGFFNSQFLFAGIKQHQRKNSHYNCGHEVETSSPSSPLLEHSPRSSQSPSGFILTCSCKMSQAFSNGPCE